jgi:hypothetical protein
LHDLRTQLTVLDDEITELRNTINPPDSPLRDINAASTDTPPAKTYSTKYDVITDAVKLGRLVTAREKTKQALESKAGWAAMEQSKAETVAAIAAEQGPGQA